MGVRGACAAIAAVLALSLAACSGDDGPPPARTAAPPTSTATASATPAQVAPTLPATATPDPKGAEVFVRYFWDVFNYAYASGDPVPLEAIAAPTCKFCADAVDQVSRIKAQGGTVSGGRVTLDEVLTVPPEIADGAIMTVVVSQEAGTTTYANGGRPPSHSKPIKSRGAQIVLENDGIWRVLGVELARAKGQA